MGMFFLIDLHMHCKSGQSVDVPPLYSTWTVCQMLAVDTVNLHASCLGTFDQKEILGPSPTANLSGLGTSAVWHEAILGGIFLWVMWSGRHYMLPVITLCHMLSFNCFSYLNVVFTVFFFLLYALCTAYTPHHHIYVMNDVYDLASLVPFCLPVFIYSCPLWLPLSETALFFLLEMFHLTTAAVVTLFLLYIFSHLNSPDAWEPLLLHISLTLSLKLFQGVSFHHFQIISFLFSIEIRYSHRYSKYHFSCIWQAIGLFSHGSAVLCQQHLSWFLFST